MTRVLIVSVVKTLAVTMKFVYLIANVRPVAQAHVINCGSLDRTYVSFLDDDLLCTDASATSSF